MSIGVIKIVVSVPRRDEVAMGKPKEDPLDFPLTPYSLIIPIRKVSAAINQ